MPTTIDFEAVSAGFSTSYSEDGFTLTSDIATSIPSQNQPFWSGKSFSNVTDGGYLLNNYSSDTVIVRNDNGQAFGASSIGIDGFNWTGFSGGGMARAGSSSVTFTFTGIRASDNMAFDWTASPTDMTEGFQNILLPPEFAAGLIELRWTVTGGTGWGAFDNLNVQLNRAPTVDALAFQATAGTTLERTFVGHDADGQALTYEIVGGQPEGVFLGDNGTFFVISDPNAGGSQAVTFQYRAFDGSEYSAPATVTVTVAPPPAGPDMKGTTRSDTLNGTSGGERMYGFNGDDKLYGNGGADKIYGGDGKDTMSGGDGHDLMSGQDGNDRLEGGMGNDTMTGDDDNDSLSGNDGNDLIFGGDDKDTIAGGAGNDSLSGGSDNDQFVFTQGFGKDVLYDFRPGHWEYDDHRNHDDDDNHHSSGGWYDWGYDNDHHGSSSASSSFWSSIFSYFGGYSSSSSSSSNSSSYWNNHREWDGGDTIRISPAAFGSFSDLMAHAKQTWYGTVITDDDGSSLTLVGVSLKSLHAEDFIFS
jgi:Ca2+-binding RTX toxin-like protein